MIFQVHMKCPDALEDGIQEAVNSTMLQRQLSPEVGDSLLADARLLACKFFQWKECVTLEFDTVEKFIYSIIRSIAFSRTAESTSPNEYLNLKNVDPVPKAQICIPKEFAISTKSFTGIFSGSRIANSIPL